MPSLSLVRQIVADARRKTTKSGWVKDDASTEAAVSAHIAVMRGSDIADVLAELILRVEKLEKGD